jgi:aminoglycoside phosphotransferase
MLLNADGTVGFVDCGKVGRADRYLYLAVLAPEASEKYTPGAVTILSKTRGIRKCDAAKAQYYNVLYDSFERHVFLLHWRRNLRPR